MNDGASAALINEFFEKAQQQIPLLKAMGMEVAEYDGAALSLVFPLDKNINDKGTGFAGSLNAATTFCAWALIKLLLQDRGMAFDLAVVSSNSEYKKPVTGDFSVKSRLPSKEDAEVFLEKLSTKGKASLAIKATIKQDGEEAVIYQGVYVAFPK